MKGSKQNSRTIYILIGLMLLVLIALIVTSIMIAKQYHVNNQVPVVYAAPIQKESSDKNDKVDQPEFHHYNSMNSHMVPHVSVYDVVNRDYRVLNDPLYPALARQDAFSLARFMNEPRLQAHATQGMGDTYRLVGYMVSQEEKTDAWKLYARQTQGSHRSVADFYAEPASRDMQGMKIALSQGGITSPPLRDVYNIPDSLNVTHPMFDRSATYSVVSLPNSDFGSLYF